MDKTPCLRVEKQRTVNAIHSWCRNFRSLVRLQFSVQCAEIAQMVRAKVNQIPKSLKLKGQCLNLKHQSSNKDQSSSLNGESLLNPWSKFKEVWFYASFGLYMAALIKLFLT